MIIVGIVVLLGHFAAGCIFAVEAILKEANNG